MTARKYRSAMGKTVDIGALMLQNENRSEEHTSEPVTLESRMPSSA